MNMHSTYIHALYFSLKLLLYIFKSKNKQTNKQKPQPTSWQKTQNIFRSNELKGPLGFRSIHVNANILVFLVDVWL